jgi:hypothetical protein
MRSRDRGTVAGLSRRAFLSQAAALWAVPLVLVPVCWVLAAVALGGRHPLRDAGPALRVSPGRHVVVALATVLLALVAWLVALLLSLFLPGFVGYAGTWVWFGLTAMLVLRCWCSLHRRADPDRDG